MNMQQWNAIPFAHHFIPDPAAFNLDKSFTGL
jgi:hypothetical protein